MKLETEFFFILLPETISDFSNWQEAKLHKMLFNALCCRQILSVCRWSADLPKYRFQQSYPIANDKISPSQSTDFKKVFKF